MLWKFDVSCSQSKHDVFYKWNKDNNKAITGKAMDESVCLALLGFVGSINKLERNYN